MKRRRRTDAEAMAHTMESKHHLKTRFYCPGAVLGGGPVMAGPTQGAREIAMRLLDGRYSSRNPLRGLEDEIALALTTFAEAVAAAERERIADSAMLCARYEQTAGGRAALESFATALRVPADQGGA